MEKLRKFFVLLFGALSVFFAVAAVHNHFYENKLLESSKNFVPWGEGLPAAAREADKLVFVAASTAQIPARLRRVLDGRFVVTKIDKTAHYADFAVIDIFLKRSAATRESFACAVFTPEMKPVYIASKIDERRLAKFLLAASEAYAENGARLRKNAEALTLRLGTGAAARIAMPPRAGSLEIPAMFAAASGQYSPAVPLAVLTENARLAFAAYKARRSHFARENARRYLAQLNRRFASEAAPRDKMLIARALADIAFAADAAEVAGLKAAAETALQADLRKLPAVDKALALSVLSRAYAVFGNEKYLEAAKAAAEDITNADAPNARAALARARGETRAPQNPPSALDLAISANAICDYADVSGDKSAPIAALMAIAKLDAEYLFNGIWTINSTRSPTAKFARMAILDDAEMPSYAGEAAQAIARIKRRLPLAKISPAETTVARLGSAIIPLENITRASIRLANAM